MAKRKTPRNRKGDIAFDYKIDWNKIREDRSSYVFKYYDKKNDHFFPFFGLFGYSDPRIDTVRTDPKFFEKRLYETRLSRPTDFSITYHNWQLGLLVDHFKEVFEERSFIEGYEPMHKYFRLIMPKAIHDGIAECINDFGLMPIRDLIFEIIAIAQEKYTDEIAFWEKPEMQKLVRTASKETANAIHLIERLDQTEWMRGDSKAKKPSELLHINFVLNDGTIKIGHPWLAKEFIEHFKDYYSNLGYKNWKSDLERYPERFQDNIRQQNFKYKLAKSLYNLLTKAGVDGSAFFPITEKAPTPNNLMLCIAKILEFSLIPVAGPEELDEIKVKNIRNWIKRKELKQSVTFAEVSPNKTKLLKYFDSHFIEASGDVKRADALTLAFYLAKRFDLHNLFPEIAHIVQSLNEVRIPISHQMFSEGVPRPVPFEEFGHFQKLIREIKTKRKLTSAKFMLEGENVERELSQRLPLYLIEEAIRKYSEDHQVELDTDLAKTSVSWTTDGFTVKNEGRFNEPNERFMVLFVKSFYDFLLAESPPREDEMLASDRYYTIIGELLQRTRFFYHQLHPDWFIISKVKQWHDLAG